MRALAALLVALGCARQSEPAPRADVDRACASACAALTNSRCPADEPTERRNASCRATCSIAAALAEKAHCTREHQAYLACVSARSSACPSPSLAPGVALETRMGIAACQSEHQAYFRCTEPCRERGVVRTRSTRLPHSGAEREVHAELVGAGCGESAPKPANKSGAGAPCTHYSVCTAGQCSCDASGARYHARACVDGRCADRLLACSLAPAAVGYDPCRSTRP